MRLLFSICFLILLVNIGTATVPHTLINPSKKVLFIVSNAHFYGDTKIDASNHFAEIVFPYDKFIKAGYTVDFVSPEGGAIPIGYIQTSTPLIKEYLYKQDFMDLLKKTKKPSEINPANYQAVYYGGGGAAMFGVPENKEIQQIAMQVYEEQQGIVSAVCHGSAGLVHLKTKDGQYLVKNKTVNGFPDLFENMDAKYYQTFPFSIEKMLEKRGGNFKYSKEGWDGFMVSDGRLITGQDPTAAGLVAEQVIEQLDKKSNGFSAERQQKFVEIFQNWEAEDKPGLAAGLIQNGKVIYLKGFGAADLEQQISNTPDTKFQIGALSQQFTAFTILFLEEQGQLSLADDIRKYLPEMPDLGHTITIKHLLSQSSGLHEIYALKSIAGWDADDVFTQQDALRLIYQQQQLDYIPGTQFSRTSTGFILLAEIVQKATGQSLAEYSRQHIFEPLGMTNTLFCDDYEMMIPNVANSYQATVNGYKKRALNDGMEGLTNLYTSAADLCRWYLNLDQPKIGSPNLIKKMNTPVTLQDGTTYNSTAGQLAYNQQFFHYERGASCYWNYGLAGGYGSNIFTFPDQQLVSFVLGNNNQYNGQPAMSMAYELLANDFPEPPSVDFNKVKTITLSAKELAKHEGYYWNEDGAYGRRIYNKNDTLRYARLGSNRESLIVPLSKNKFQMVVDSDDKIFISFDQKDGVKRMLFKGGISDEFVSEAYRPVTYSAVELAQFTGMYYCSALNTTYTLSLKDKQLVASHLGKRDINFTPIKTDVFSGSEWYFGSIQFERNTQQKVSGFTINLDGVKHLRFEKVKNL